MKTAKMFGIVMLVCLIVVLCGKNTLGYTKNEKEYVIIYVY